MAHNISSLSSLTEVSIGKILDLEPRFTEIYFDRLGRLQRLVMPVGQLQSSLSDVILLTERAHSIGNDLQKTLAFFESRCPRTVKDKITHLTAASRSLQSQFLLSMPPEVQDGVDGLTQKADEFLVWIHSEEGQLAVGPETLLLDALRSKFSGEDESDRSIITTRFVTQYQLLQSFNSQLAVLDNLITLLRIVRGLLYLGIYDKHGKKLDQRNTSIQLTAVAVELAGNVIPGLGLLLSLKKLLTAWLEMDETPEVLKHAAFAERYLSTYDSLLSQWILVAEQLHQSVKGATMTILDPLDTYTDPTASPSSEA